jgi:hypothetical protein
VEHVKGYVYKTITLPICWERKKKRRKSKEQKTLPGHRVFNFTSMVYLTQVHKLKETISVSFFKYGKQKPYITAYNELNFPAPS